MCAVGKVEGHAELMTFWRNDFDASKSARYARCIRVAVRLLPVLFHSHGPDARQCGRMGLNRSLGIDVAV